MTTKIEMNSWAEVPKNQNIVSWNFFGCFGIFIIGKKNNAVFHIRQDRSDLIKFCKKYVAENSEILEIWQFLPEGAKPISFSKSQKIRFYKITAYDNNNKLINLCNLFKIPYYEIASLDINAKKSSNAIAIFGNTIQTKNLNYA